ncbi:glycosyltransferase family 2 protein [Trinickia sp. NRRL B-1857]|uniref:glycosyltransferase family 2 protein n=1 Tax=Trinickia sp. NRRL B-1857 TaxID=3162879 RepID=UPI003D275B46
MPLTTSASPRRPTLGVAIIALNAERRLAQCLSALSFADDIVVIDGGSTDTTATIAQAHGARLIVEPNWPGFGPQKNRAVAALDTDWILSIDTDEVVTPELAASIRQALDTPRADVYALDRISNFCGRWIRHGGWYPDWVPRLFKRGAARFSDDLVHERLVFDAQPAQLAGQLLHYSYDDLESALDKLNAYSTASAKQRHAKGKRGSLRLALAHGVWAFVRSYFVRRGFLDGRMGFIVAVATAEGTYYRYLKLMLMSELAQDSGDTAHDPR